jgi:hypothetical protein
MEKNMEKSKCRCLTEHCRCDHKTGGPSGALNSLVGRVTSLELAIDNFRTKKTTGAMFEMLDLRDAPNATNGAERSDRAD